MSEDVKWIKINTKFLDGASFKFMKKAKIDGIADFRDKLEAVWFELLGLAGQINQEGKIISSEIPYKSYEDISIMFDRNEKEIELCMNWYINKNMIEIIDDCYYLTNWCKYQSIDGLEKIREQNRIRQKIWYDKHKNEEKEKPNIIPNATITDSSQDNNISYSYSLSNSLSYNIYKGDLYIEEKENKYIQEKEIFDYWNEKDIIKHRELNQNIIKAIQRVLSIYSVENIKIYIERYNKVIKDNNYFFNYKWALADFLNRKDGISSFSDEGSKWISYQEFVKNDSGKKKSAYDKKFDDLDVPF